MERNQLLLKLNSANKTFTKLNELEKGCTYAITNAETISTKYGQKIFLELDSEHKIILPDRFAKLLSWGDCNTLVGLKMLYNGTKETNNGNKMHDIEFF